jgi:CBS domain containing-hemolysin-like protein
MSNNDDILVYDNAGETPIGVITLLDIARADKNTAVKTILRPLPEIQKNISLLSFFSRKKNFYSSFYRITDETGGNIGILDTFSIFSVIFHG